VVRAAGAGVALGTAGVPRLRGVAPACRAAAALAVLGIPLATALWVAGEAPRAGQITRPNPVVYASQAPPSLLERLVPAEALVRATAGARARYAFGIDGVNNAGEAIAYTGASVLPIWNEYTRGALLPATRLDALLRDGDVPLLLLSRARLATGLLDDVMPIVRARCREARAPGAVGAGWTLWQCGPGAAAGDSRSARERPACASRSPFGDAAVGGLAPPARRSAGQPSGGVARSPFGEAAVGGLAPPARRSASACPRAGARWACPASRAAC
ncbi:MAG: hypothetical protein WEB13_12185, partial [Dehalococcoidia bacterium]